MSGDVKDPADYNALERAIVDAALDHQRAIVVYSLPVYVLVDLASREVVDVRYASPEELTDPLRVEWSNHADPFMSAGDVPDDVHALAIEIADEGGQDGAWPEWGTL